MTEKEGCEIDLRFGRVLELFYDIAGKKMPKQLDLLDEWLPGFIIEVRDEEGKIDAEYIDSETTIYASRHNGSLYLGSNTRINQILGRLIGTAKGNQEKERKAAELIRKDTAAILIDQPDATDTLRATIHEHLKLLSDDQLNEFHEKLCAAVWDSTVERYKKNGYERLDEPFPIDDEVWDGLMYNAGYQLHLYSYEGIINAFGWLIIGGLLRNEAGRVVRMYHSGFSAVNRQIAEDGEILDKLQYLFFPEQYQSTYSGNDLEKKYPGISWQCDGCGEILENQAGFDDHLPVWQCRHCGHLNRIDISAISDNTEDRLNGFHYSDEDLEEFNRAIAERMQELKKN
jgi:hypothetical protein